MKYMSAVRTMTQGMEMAAAGAERAVHGAPLRWRPGADTSQRHHRKSPATDTRRPWLADSMYQ